MDGSGRSVPKIVRGYLIPTDPLRSKSLLMAHLANKNRKEQGKKL